MNQFAHWVDNTVQTLQPMLIAIALLGWGIGLWGIVSFRRAKSKGSPRPMDFKVIIGFLLFGGVILGELAINQFIKHAAWEEIRPKLDSEIENVYLNGNEVIDKDALVSALKNVRDAPAHHSHPTTRYQIQVTTSQGLLNLCLGRDSDNSQEYWVFYPGYHSTELSEIGRTFTNALDDR